MQGNKKTFIKASVAHYGIEWPCVALYGLVRPFLSYASDGLILSYMALYGQVSILLDLYRLFSRSYIQIHLVLFHQGFYYFLIKIF